MNNYLNVLNALYGSIYFGCFIQIGMFENYEPRNHEDLIPCSWPISQNYLDGLVIQLSFEKANIEKRIGRINIIK